MTECLQTDFTLPESFEISLMVEERHTMESPIGVASPRGVAHFLHDTVGRLARIDHQRMRKGLRS